MKNEDISADINATTVKAAWDRRKTLSDGSTWWVVGVPKTDGIKVEVQEIPVGRWPFNPSVQVGCDLRAYEEHFDDSFEQIAIELAENYQR